MTFDGAPSDDTPDILAVGNGDITTMFVSMAQRHPDGEDAGYLRWHSLDHRPEQHRLSGLRASLRVVSTPACRAARARAVERFDDVDHVMTYFWTGIKALDTFDDLSVALRTAGRAPFILPPVDRGVYAVHRRVAAATAKVGADVLPWRPTKGIYLLIEEGGEAPLDLVDVPGVAGLWSGTSVATPLSSVGDDQTLTYFFLDCDPVEVAQQLRPVLEQRWIGGAIAALFAAPFQTVLPYEWDRFLP